MPPLPPRKNPRPPGSNNNHLFPGKPAQLPAAAKDLPPQPGDDESVNPVAPDGPRWGQLFGRKAGPTATDGKVRCRACGGTGRSSNNGRCVPCDGTGRQGEMARRNGGTE